MPIRARYRLVAIVALVGRPAAAQLAEPMQIRNLNPLVAIFGLPAWDTVAPGNRFSASLEIANHFEFSSSGGEALGSSTAKQCGRRSASRTASLQGGRSASSCRCSISAAACSTTRSTPGTRHSICPRRPQFAAREPAELRAPPLGAHVLSAR